MENISSLFHNQILGNAILGWFIAQLLKVIIVLFNSKKLDFHRFIGSGGMPSSHSSFVSALTVSVGEKMGFDSALFAVCFVLSLIVMYDAAGVRRAAGKQAQVLNKIMEEIEDEQLHFEERMKELLGHTPIEVIAGLILGIFIGFVC